MSFRNRYSISEDFPNQKVSSEVLVATINTSDLSAEFDYLNVGDDGADNCDIYTLIELSVEQKAILDGIIVAHSGTPPIKFEWKASSKMLGDAKTVIEDEVWQDLGGAVTNLAAFVPNVVNAWGRCVGQAKVSGSGAQIRIIRESDGEVCMAAPHDLPNSGAWVIFQFWANTNQSTVPDRFVLQGRLNGATSMEVRDVAISILEKLN